MLSGGRVVRLRPATMADADLILVWQADQRTRRFAFNPTVPSRDEHLRWMRGCLADADCHVWLITLDGGPAGVVRLQRQAVEQVGDGYEVSIFVAPGLYGRGLGTAGLALARRLKPDAVLIARVLPENEASRALFLRAGYVCEQGVYVQRPPSVTPHPDR